MSDMFCLCPPRDGIEANKYASSIFKECIYNVPETCSLIFGYISFFIWCLAMLPAIRMAFRLRDAGTLSAALLIIWIGGDVLNLISTVLTNQLQTQIAIAVFWLASDLICIGQMIYYNIKKRRVYKKLNLPLPPIIPSIGKRKNKKEKLEEQEEKNNRSSFSTYSDEENKSYNQEQSVLETEKLLGEKSKKQNSKNKNKDTVDMEKEIKSENENSDSYYINGSEEGNSYDYSYTDGYYSYDEDEDDEEEEEPMFTNYEEMILSLDEDEELRKKIVETMKKYNSMDLNVLDIETREHYVKTRSKYTGPEIFILLLILALIICNLIWVGYAGNIALSLNMPGLKTCPVAKEPSKAANITGQIIAYILPFVYSMSRISQIIQNVKTKQVAGLSIGLFLLACMGDITQVINMVVHQFDRAYQISKIPFVLGCAIPASLDIFIMCQYGYYTKKNAKLIKEQAEAEEVSENEKKNEENIDKKIQQEDQQSSKEESSDLSESIESSIGHTYEINKSNSIKPKEQLSSLTTVPIVTNKKGIHEKQYQAIHFSKKKVNSETFNLCADVNTNVFKGMSRPGISINKNTPKNIPSHNHYKVAIPTNSKFTPKSIDPTAKQLNNISIKQQDASKKKPIIYNQPTATGKVSRPTSVALTPIFFGRSKSFSVFTTSMMLASESSPVIQPAINKKQMPLDPESNSILETITRERIPSLNECPLTVRPGSQHMTPLHVVGDDVIKSMRPLSRKSIEAQTSRSVSGVNTNSVLSGIVVNSSTTPKHIHSRSHSIKNSIIGNTNIVKHSRSHSKKNAITDKPESRTHSNAGKHTSITLDNNDNIDNVSNLNSFQEEIIVSKNSLEIPLETIETNTLPIGDINK